MAGAEEARHLVAAWLDVAVESVAVTMDYSAVDPEAWRLASEARSTQEAADEMIAARRSPAGRRRGGRLIATVVQDPRPCHGGAMDSPSGMAGVFDRAADTYDAVGVEWFGPIAQGLVDELAVLPGERVLEIGCGRGAALLPLAQAAGPTGAVLGIDLAPRMVARTAHDVADLAGVEVRVADAAAPGLPEESFDVVTSSLVLFFLADPAAAVRTWADLLVPGGRMGVTTFAPPDPRWERIDALFSPYLPPAMLGQRTRGRQGPFTSDEGVEDLLRGGGLVDVRTAARTVEARFRDAEQLLAFTWSHGQRAMWEAVPETEHAALRARVGEEACLLGDGSGALTLTQAVRYTLGRRPW